ncbi:MAG: SRPBCC family protein [Flavobacteriales bacterium]
MNKLEFKEVVNASVEKTWEVLYSQYGEISVHHPGMPKSHYLGDSDKGEKGSARRCYFDDKLFVDETITEVNDKSGFKIEVNDHNLPLMKKEMGAEYQLKSIGENKTEITMTSYSGTSPGFLFFLFKGKMGKGLKKHLFGLKYYIETGKAISADNYSEIFKSYKG